MQSIHILIYSKERSGILILVISNKNLSMFQSILSNYECEFIYQLQLELDGFLKSINYFDSIIIDITYIGNTTNNIIEILEVIRAVKNIKIIIVALNRKIGDKLLQILYDKGFCNIITNKDKLLIEILEYLENKESEKSSIQHKKSKKTIKTFQLLFSKIQRFLVKVKIQKKRNTKIKPNIRKIKKTKSILAYLIISDILRIIFNLFIILLCSFAVTILFNNFIDFSILRRN